MNLKQKHQKILDWMFSGKCARTKMNICEKELFTNGCVGFFLGKDEMYLDTEKILNRGIARAFDENNLIVLELSDILNCYDKKILSVLKNNGLDTYVDNKYMKMFEREAVFKQMPNMPLAPIFAYNSNDELEGVIMPIKIY